ncbi:hypothetical protein [Lonepinella sp. BR2474]|uniref:hypothetical protein n=1 Tax=Lonepinella sp. BR2474 TaxID=3434548 RepID=UPI003F6DCF26
MKKLLLVSLIVFSVTSCADFKSSMNGMMNNFSSYSIPVSLNNETFVEKVVKQVYPTAYYTLNGNGEKYLVTPDKESGSERPIYADVKDIKTENNEKRYVLISKYAGNVTSGEQESAYLVILNREDDKWELDLKVDLKNFFPVKEELSQLGDLKFIDIGYNKVAFKNDIFYGSGKFNNIGLGYLVNEKLYSISIDACPSFFPHSMGTQSMPVYSCEFKVRKDLVPVGGYYPLEFSYYLESPHIEYTSGEDKRKKANAIKPKLVVKFDTQTQSYKFPTDFEQLINKNNDLRTFNFYDYFKK